MKLNRKFLLSDKKCVSAIIGTILMVSITIAIAVTTYVYLTVQSTSYNDTTKDIFKGYVEIGYNHFILVFHDVHDTTTDSYYEINCFSGNNLNLTIIDSLKNKYVYCHYFKRQWVNEWLTISYFEDKDYLREYITECS